MQYYDRERDNPFDGAIFTSDLLAFLHDITRREPNDRDVRLSLEGLAGLSELLNMMSQCMRDIARQVDDNLPT